MSETTIRKKSPRLFIKVTRDNLPQIKDRYPYIYLEHGRLEVDDSSIKWIDAQGVFSTSVEVFLYPILSSLTSSSLLHVRGGVSQNSKIRPALFSSSPRPWRCFPPQS